MANRSSYSVKYPSAGQQFAQGFGQSFAEQAPKEMERYRLAEGLKKFQDEAQNMTPLQQGANLMQYAGLSGFGPAAQQGILNLARQQAMANAYRGNAPQGGAYKDQIPKMPSINTPLAPSQNANPVAELSNVMQGPASKSLTSPERTLPEERGQPQVVPVNPLAKEFVNIPPWSPEKRIGKVNEYMDRGFLPEKAEELASQEEMRERETPKTSEQERQRLTAVRDELRKSMDDKLKLKLQKPSLEGMFGDATGEYINNLYRSAEADLAKNPASLEDVSNKWTDEALRLAKTKTQLDKLAKTTGIEDLVGTDVHDKLKTYSKIFRNTGNQEEFQKILQADLGMSPQGAAYMSWEMQPSLNKYINSYSPSTGIGHSSKDASRAAANILDNLSKDDSVLAAAYALKLRDPDFDEKTFFNYLDDYDNKLNPRQQQEVAEGKQRWRPYWGDYIVFPSSARRILEAKK